MNNPRNIQPTGKGGAHYAGGHQMPPEWLVISIPGATEARAAFESEVAKGQELSREFRASSEALVALRDSDPLASDLEAAERAYKAADKAVDAQAKRSVAALRRFDALVYGTADPAGFRAMAAEHALKKHAEAVVAWETLKAALTEREQAHGAAGAPGCDWRNSAAIGYRSLSNIETVVRPIVEAFDVAALKLTMEGKRVPTGDEMAEAVRAAIEAANAKHVATVRARSRKEGF